MYHFHIFFDTYFFMQRCIGYNHPSTIALTWQFHFSIPFHVVIHNICDYEALKLKKTIVLIIIAVAQIETLMIKSYCIVSIIL